MTSGKMENRASCMDAEEIKKAIAKDKKILVVFQNKVLDLTRFIHDHPGGAAVITQFTGKHIDNILFNERYYKHSRYVADYLVNF